MGSAAVGSSEVLWVRRVTPLLPLPLWSLQLIEAGTPSRNLLTD